MTYASSEAKGAQRETLGGIILLMQARVKRDRGACIAGLQTKGGETGMEANSEELEPMGRYAVPIWGCGQDGRISQGKTDRVWIDLNNPAGS